MGDGFLRSATCKSKAMKISFRRAGDGCGVRGVWFAGVCLVGSVWWNLV
jgi:hypothetical protein